MDEIKCRACKRRPANPEVSLIDKDLFETIKAASQAALNRLIMDAKKREGLCYQCSSNLSIHKIEQACEAIRRGETLISD